MLRLLTVERLADWLWTTPSKLEELCAQLGQFVGKKQLPCGRPITYARGELRIIQRRLLHRVLTQRVSRSDFSYGGIKGKAIRDNALAHAGNRFGFTVDISRFYPSIRHWQIYNLLVRDFEWSPDVSRICTRLTTFDGEVPMGFCTSPLLADRLLRPVDFRVAGLCKSLGLTFTRWVDDFAITGSKFPFEEDRGVPRQVVRILREHGFQVKTNKTKCGEMRDDKFLITKLRINRRGNVDVPKSYLSMLSKYFAAAEMLAKGKKPPAKLEFLPRDRLRGKVEFVCQINPNRSALRHRVQRIDWDAATKNAERLCQA